MTNHQLQTVMNVLAESSHFHPDKAEAIAIVRGMMQAEPVACLVVTEQGVMVWPIDDFNDAGTYCEPNQFPQYLYTQPAPQAVPAKKCKYSDPLCPCQDGHQCHYEGKDAWTAPQAVPAGWVSLEDGLPSPHQMVLVARESHVTTGSYTPAFGWAWEEVDGEDEDSIATHWMPLPASPKVAV